MLPTGASRELDLSANVSDDSCGHSGLSTNGPSIQELQAEQRSKRTMKLFDKIVKKCCFFVPMFIQDFISHQLKEGLPESAWFENMSKLPKVLQYFVSICFNVGFWIVFFVLFIQSYQQGRNNSFISLSMTSGDCQEVGRPTSGTFLVSTGTNSSDPVYAWSTDTDFMYNSSSYNLIMNSYTGTMAQFNAQVNSAGAALQAMGKKGRTRDLAWNLLAWSTFTYRSQTDTSGIFEFISLGDPAVIFERDLLIAAISGSTGFCNTPTDVTYGTGGTYTITLPNYMNTQSCPQQLNPNYLMSSALNTEPPSDLSLVFDMNSFAVAAAINSGLVDVSTLVGVPSLLADDDYSTGYYYGADYGGGGGGGATDDTYMPTTDDGGSSYIGGPVGAPFPITTGVMVDTNSATQHDSIGCIHACPGAKLTFTSCAGDTTQDTYFRLIDNSTGVVVAFNDDACGTASEIVYTVPASAVPVISTDDYYTGGGGGGYIPTPMGDNCTLYCLNIGCYGASSCSAVVDAYSTAIPDDPANSTNITATAATMAATTAAASVSFTTGGSSVKSTTVTAVTTNTVTAAVTMERATNDDVHDHTPNPNVHAGFARHGIATAVDGSRLTHRPVGGHILAERLQQAQKAKYSSSTQSAPSAITTDAHANNNNNKRRHNRRLGDQQRQQQQHRQYEEEDVESDAQKVRRTLSKVDYNLHGRRVSTSYSSSNGNNTKGYENEGYFKAYYSSNFLGMDPIYCFHYNSGGASCFLMVQSSLFYPILNSFGTGNLNSAAAFNPSKDDAPDWSSMYCNCSAVPKMNADDFTNCNLFSLMPTFVYFPEDGNPSSENQYQETLAFAQTAYDHLQNMTDGDIYTSRNGYNVGVSSLWQFFGNVYETGTWGNIYAPLCDNCTAITVIAYDMGQNINEYMLQITSGTCKNSLYDQGFSQLTDAPPLPLVERYYECVLLPFDAGFQALGLSLGNTQLSVAVVSFVALWILSMILRFFFHYTDGVFATIEEPEEDEYGYNKTQPVYGSYSGGSGSGGSGVSEADMQKYVLECTKPQQQQLHKMLSVLLEESKHWQTERVVSKQKLQPICMMDTSRVGNSSNGSNSGSSSGFSGGIGAAAASAGRGGAVGMYRCSAGADSDDEHDGGEPMDTSTSADMNSVVDDDAGFLAATDPHTNADAHSNADVVSRAELAELITGMRSMAVDMQQLQSNMGTIAAVVRDVTGCQGQQQADNSSKNRSLVGSGVNTVTGINVNTTATAAAGGNNNNNDGMEQILQSLINELEVIKLASNATLSSRYEQEARLRHQDRSGGGGGRASIVGSAPGVNNMNVERGRAKQWADEEEGGIMMNPMQRYNEGHGGAVQRKKSVYAEL